MRDESTYTTRFGDVRSLLAQSPSPMIFARLCKALAQLWRLDAARVNAEVVPYVSHALTRWPDALRAHPMFWLALWREPSEHDFAPAQIIRSLSLDHQALGDAIAQRLAQVSQWGELRALDLSGNALTTAGADALASAPLPHLEVLTLGNNSLGDAGVAALCSAPWLATLSALNLWRVGLSDAGALAITQPLVARASLAQLDLRENNLSETTRVALKASFGERVRLG